MKRYDAIDDDGSICGRKGGRKKRGKTKKKKLR
jgi:hypothetical protein